MSAVSRFFKGLSLGSKSFGKDLSSFVNAVILSIVYFLGIGVISIIAKLFRKNFLEMKPSDGKDGYWSDLDIKKRPVENYYRQF